MSNDHTDQYLEYKFQGIPESNCVCLSFDSVAFSEKDGVLEYEQIIRMRGSVRAHGFQGFITGYSNIGTLEEFARNIAKNIKGDRCDCLFPIVTGEAHAYTMSPDQHSNFIRIVFIDRWNAFLIGLISAPVAIESTHIHMNFSIKLDLDSLYETLCDLETISAFFVDLIR